MKLSLAWITQFLDIDTKKIHGRQIADLLNRTTCEIDEVIAWQLDPSRFYIAKLTEFDDQTATLFCEELNQAYVLPARTDLVVGWHYLLYATTGVVSWAKMSDVGSGKDGLVGPVQDAANWREQVVCSDEILVIDNKSITHRADLWGHYGMAREIAVLLNCPLRSMPLREIAFVQSVPQEYPIKVIKKSDSCHRISAIPVDMKSIGASSVDVVLQLARVDTRAHNVVVDATNMVMLQLGQPMHAFDRGAFPTNALTVRQAHDNEALKLLDGTTVQLTPADLVVSNDTKAVSVAGIMGGSDSGVYASSLSLLVEAGCFDAGTIRKTAQRLKIRTESSARFEKTLDPSMTETALELFLHIIEQQGYHYCTQSVGVSLGVVPSVKIIEVPFQQVSSMLGTEIPAQFVQNSLGKLGFSVEITDSAYKVTVPSWRSQKDVTIAQDVIEEIGRLYGYGSIAARVPSRQMMPFSVHREQLTQELKQLLAYGLGMNEVQNYPMYDETLLAKLGWEPTDSVRVKNPLSATATRLVTSLVPHLIGNVVTNAPVRNSLRFFELNSIWKLFGPSDWSEHRVLSFVWWEKEQDVSLTAAKRMIATLFDAVGVTATYAQLLPAEQGQSTTLVNPANGLGKLEPWHMPYQSAAISLDNVVIGTCGMVDPAFVQQVVPFGKLFVCEINIEPLLTYRRSLRYIAPSKYPSTYADLSMQVPLSVTVAQLQEAIRIDARISSVELLDLFEKAEWGAYKGVTVRVTMQDEHETLAKPTIDTIWSAVVSAVQELGCILR